MEVRGRVEQQLVRMRKEGKEFISRMKLFLKEAVQYSFPNEPSEMYLLSLTSCPKTKCGELVQFCYCQNNQKIFQ